MNMLLLIVILGGILITGSIFMSVYCYLKGNRNTMWLFVVLTIIAISTTVTMALTWGTAWVQE